MLRITDLSDRIGARTPTDDTPIRAAQAWLQARAAPEGTASGRP